MIADIETGDIYGVKETCDFNADILGSVKEPFALQFDDSTTVSKLTADGTTMDMLTNILGQHIHRIKAPGIYIINGSKVAVDQKNINNYAR